MLHVTTRIPGRRHDDLLRKLGYSGFPLLVFLDADGEVLARPRERSVASFEETLAMLKRYDDLVKQVAAGEMVRDFDVFEAKYVLGKVRGAKAVAQAKELQKRKDTTTKQQAKLAQVLFDEEAGTLVMGSMRGGDDLRRAAERMVVMLDTGGRPSRHVAANFWGVLARYGRKAADPKMLQRAAVALRETFPKDQRMIGWADSLDQQVDKLLLEKQ